MEQRRGKAGIIIVLVLVGLCLSCIACGVLGMLSRDPVTQPPGPKLVPQLTLRASGGSEQQLVEALSVLRRRLNNAKIPHEIDRLELKFSVRLPEDSLQVLQATRLLLAGGDLVFKIIIRPKEDRGVQLDRKNLDQSRWDEEAAKVRAAQLDGSYDAETFAYDLISKAGDEFLLENPGFPGFHVASARYLWTDGAGQYRASTRLSAPASPGKSELLLQSASGFEPGQTLRLGAVDAAGKAQVYRILGVDGTTLELDRNVDTGAPAETEVVRGFFEIRYTMSPEGAKAYADYARENAHLPEATIMDGQIETTATWGDAPSGSFDPSVEWSWTNTTSYPWSEDDARYYSTLMTSGRLPIEMMLEDD